MTSNNTLTVNQAVADFLNTEADDRLIATIELEKMVAEVVLWERNPELHERIYSAWLALTPCKNPHCTMCIIRESWSDGKGNFCLYPNRETTAQQVAWALSEGIEPHRWGW